jgi:hypothetical protein
MKRSEPDGDVCLHCGSSYTDLHASCNNCDDMKIRTPMADRMTKLLWTTDAPEKPGWYWCQASGDQDGPYAARVAEFIVRVDWIGTELAGTWLRAPGDSKCILKSDWHEGVLWAGPIEPPTETE